MPAADMREYQREWMAKRRRDWFEGKKCEHCRTTSGLELHFPPWNRRSVGSVWSYSEERRARLLEGVVVLCEPCRQKQIDRELGQNVIVHGTRYRGYKNGCRCSRCRNANANYIQHRRDESGDPGVN